MRCSATHSFFLLPIARLIASARVILFGILNCLRRPTEWLRVLKPGGVLLIFDGNHYRYLFDERYARVHKAWEDRSDHQMLGVDARVIDDIAEKLPLSRRMRPEWDVSTLSELGAQAQSTVLKTLTDPKTGEVLVTDFVVRAVKTS